MRIGIDFHVFDGKFQGSRSHVLGLFAELVSFNPRHEYLFFLDNVRELANNQAFRRDNVQLIRMRSASSVVRLAWQLPTLRRKHRLDLLHCQYVTPIWSAKGNAVTVHDVLYENYPQYFAKSFVLRSRLLISRSARKAEVLCTVSNYSRTEIARCYGVAEDRIVVLHNAVNHERFYPGPDGSEYIRSRGLTEGGFILSVGRIEPRKNYPALLDAYGRMTGDVPPLVIVGQRDFDYGEFERLLAALPATRPVRILSDVSDEQLPALYRHALVFAYPSFAEGFGMPVVEAMASGCPVVTSDTTALLEVAGTAGIVIDPARPSTLTEALQLLCNDATIRKRLIGAGIERAKAFSWRESAAALSKAYDSFAADL